MTTQEFAAGIEKLGMPMREAAATLGIHFTAGYKIMRGEQAVPPYLGVSLRNLLKLQEIETAERARKGARRKDAVSTPTVIELASALERVERRVVEIAARLPEAPSAKAPSAKEAYPQGIFPEYAEIYKLYGDEIIELLSRCVRRILAEREAAGPEVPLEELTDEREIFEPHDWPNMPASDEEKSK